MPSISIIKYGENFRKSSEILSSAFSDCLFSYFLLLRYFILSTKVQNGMNLYSRRIEKTKIRFSERTNGRLLSNCIPLSPPVNISLTVRRWCFSYGSFLLVMFHVGVRCTVVSVPRSLVVTCWNRADLLAVECVVFSGVLSLSKMRPGPRKN